LSVDGSRFSRGTLILKGLVNVGSAVVFEGEIERRPVPNEPRHASVTNIRPYEAPSLLVQMASEVYRVFIG